MISSPPEIQGLIVQYYDIFTEPASWKPKNDGLVFYSHDSLSASWLERPIDEDEVFRVVSAMIKDKTLGLDGFSMAFF